MLHEGKANYTVDHIIETITAQKNKFENDVTIPYYPQMDNLEEYLNTLYVQVII